MGRAFAVFTKRVQHCSMSGRGGGGRGEGARGRMTGLGIKMDVISKRPSLVTRNRALAMCLLTEISGILRGSKGPGYL